VVGSGPRTMAGGRRAAPGRRTAPVTRRLAWPEHPSSAPLTELAGPVRMASDASRPWLDRPAKRLLDVVCGLAVSNW
jgi:hypothetical protein